MRDYEIFKSECRADINNVYSYHYYFDEILDNDPVYQRAIRFLNAESSPATSSGLVGRERDRHFEQIVGNIHDMFYRLYIANEKSK